MRFAPEAEADLAPAVIGEGMTTRVRPFADANGYVTYKGLANPENYTSEELLAHNRGQIESWMAEGRQIIDIGPAEGRSLYPMATSPNYAMELNIVRDYKYLARHVLGGEPDWMAALGA